MAKNNLSVLNIVGFLIVYFYVWFRFIRERLPKTIPFNLSFSYLVIIISICIIFIATLKQIIKPNILRSVFFEEIAFIFKNYFILKIIHPLRELDNTFRNNGFIKTTLQKIAIILRILFFNLSFFSYSFSSYAYRSRRYTYYFFLFVPKIIISVIFLLDIFYFKELNLFYKTLPLGLISLGFIYIKYALEQIYNEYLEYLEKYYEIDIIQLYSNPEDEFIHMMSGEGKYKFSIKEFLSWQGIRQNYDEVKFKCQLTWNVVDKYFPNIEPKIRIWDDFSVYNKQQRNIMEKDFYYLIPITRDIYNFLNYYKLITEDIKVIQICKLLNIFVYSGYLLGWLYILVVSIHTLHFSEFDKSFLLFIFNIKEIFEPF